MTTPHTPPAAPDLVAIDRDGVRSIDDALAMGAAITDPGTRDVERLWRHAPDVIDCLATEVRRFTAASADEITARVHACHAEALRIDRYTLPMEVLALIDDVPALLAHITALRAQHAAEVAAAVAGERERCAAVCRDIASDASDDDPVSETADACAEAIERADALTAPAVTTGGA